MYKQLFLLFMGVLICTPLHGMDSNSDNVCKEIVIFNVHPDMHRTLARLNSTYNNIVEKNHRPDKKRIECLMREKGIPINRGDVIWNSNFSKCACSKLEEPKDELKILKIVALSLCDKKKLVIQEGIWDKYIEPLEGLGDLFFNKDGAVCCYGYGYRKKTEFLEYSLGGDGKSACKECVVSVDDVSMFKCDLQMVCHILAVMKAILQSPYVYTRFC